MAKSAFAEVSADGLVDKAIVLRQRELIGGLTSIVTPLGIISDDTGRSVYSGSAWQLTTGNAPMAVVLPSDIREVSQVLRFCYQEGIKVVPRGGGTSLTGGTRAAPDCIVLCLSRMNRILEISELDRLVRVQAGISNAAVSRATAQRGLQLRPQPPRSGRLQQLAAISQRTRAAQTSLAMVRRRPMCSP